MVTLRTFMSPLLKSNGEPITRDKRPVYWLDELLEGGLHAPDDLQRPLTILLCGPPGAGKSLFLQQLAYCRGLESLRQDPSAPETWCRSVLISTEVTSAATAENMAALGMTERDLFSDGHLQVFWKDDYDYDEAKPIKKGEPNLALPIPIPPLIILGTSPTNQSWEYNNLIDHVDKAWSDISPAHADLLAIDSLNVLPEQLERSKKRERRKTDGTTETETETETEHRLQEKLYKRILQLERPPNFFVLAFDTPSTSSIMPTTEHRFWEYTADVIIRFDYRHGTHDYFMRHFEVVKARFQPFALGRQLIKIFTKPPKTDTLASDPEGPKPNIKRGGMFIFPSEHFVLSKTRTGTPIIDPGDTSNALPRIKEVSSSVEVYAPMPCGPGESISDTSLNWPIEYCAELVGSGIPRNQATALVGERGLHKSYFAYQYLLDGIANGEQVLLVSFRDNAPAVLQTLKAIMEATQYVNVSDEHVCKCLQIIYQRPGYVTPQEVLHRVITAVGERCPTRAVINAVDQWETGLPLLAESSIILPCLIDFLNTQQVTSMIIGVERHGAEAIGLTSKAEVVLGFEYYEALWERPAKSNAHAFRPSDGEAIDGYPRRVQLRILPGEATRMGVVVLRAVRVPHGGAGLARAVLQYQSTSDGLPAGLWLVPLAPEYPISRS